MIAEVNLDAKISGMKDQLNTLVSENSGLFSVG